MADEQTTPDEQVEAEAEAPEPEAPKEDAANEDAPKEDASVPESDDAPAAEGEDASSGDASSDQDAEKTAKPKPKRRKRTKKHITYGQAHVKTSFNNTIVTLTDTEGNVIAWESAGSAGFKGSRKSTPFAAQVTADAAARKGMEHGLEKVEVFAKGAGSGRETAIRSLQAAGLDVTTVKDVTPQAHNGCRPRKRRRV